MDGSKPSQPFSLKLKIIAGLSISLVLAVVVQFFSFRLNNTLQTANQMVLHTYGVMDELEGINAHLTALESDVRGYIISNDPDFIKSNRQNIAEARKHYAAFSRLTKDNSGQVRHARNMHALIESKINISLKMMELVQQGKEREADSLVSTGAGRQKMDLLRIELDGAKKIESGLLRQRLETSNNLSSQVTQINTFSSIIIVLLIVFSAIIILRDINKRVKLEQRLRDNDLRLRNLFESLPIGITTFDKDGKVQFTNAYGKELVEMFSPGKTNVTLASLREEKRIFRAGTNELYPVEDSPLYKATRLGMEAQVDDLEVRHGDQKYLLKVGARPVRDTEGELMFILGTFEDITDRKRAEEEMKRARELAEESVRTKEIFLANMSHEIRTPMNAIIGFTQLLLKTPLNTEQKQFIDAVRSSGENLLTIINDILDISKIQAGMMEFEQIPFNVSSMLHSIRVLLGQKAADKKLSFDFVSDPAIPNLLIGDPTRLTQILINLVNNAIKFTEAGFVHVEAKKNRVENNMTWIRFEITDTGVGIAQDKLDSIFERFSQASSSNNRKYGGTGLGLSIVKMLTELQGGVVQVSSREGRGSVFSVDIPYRIASEQEIHEYSQQSQTAAGIADRPLHIMLVEDNVLNQKLAMRVLTDMGFTHNLARNGQEAVELVKQGKRFDVILMDLQMPLVDGYEATRILRQELNVQVPIMAMTAHALSGEKEKCLSAGMDDYISKPFKPRELLSKIRHLAAINEPYRVSEKKQVEKNSGRVTDLDYLNSLANGDQAFVKEMVQLFFTQVPEEMTLMIEALEAQKLVEVKQIAHKLKSSVLLVGAERMKDCLVKIEELALSGNHEAEILQLHGELYRLREKAFEELVPHLH